MHRVKGFNVASLKIPNQNWAARLSRSIDREFDGTADAGKAWFANNSKGSEAGLSMGEVRPRPPSGIGTEGEQERSSGGAT
jgi:hypothetical protein